MRIMNETRTKMQTSLLEANEALAQKFSKVGARELFDISSDVMAAMKNPEIVRTAPSNVLSALTLFAMAGFVNFATQRALEIDKAGKE